MSIKDGTLHADVLRVFLNKNEFDSNRIKLRQFGYATDTDEIVIRRPDGQYRFIKNYDETAINNLINNKAEQNHSHGNIASDGKGGENAQFLRGDGAWSNTLMGESIVHCNYTHQQVTANPALSHLTLKNTSGQGEMGVRFVVHASGQITIRPYLESAGAVQPILAVQGSLNVSGDSRVIGNAHCQSLQVGNGRQINIINSRDYPIPNNQTFITIPLPDLGSSVNYDNLRILSVHYTDSMGTNKINISTYRNFKSNHQSDIGTLMIDNLPNGQGTTRGVTVNFMTVQ